MPSAITLGVPTLNDLTDVVITAAAAGDVLRHDGANWVDYALDQAAVAGLTTASGPSFAHLHLADVAAITTAAESWVGPSSTTGVYFKGGNVGIGATSPGYLLTVEGSLPLVYVTAYSGSADIKGELSLRHARGTTETPTALQANDTAGNLVFAGYGSVFRNVASINARAEETFDSTHYGAFLRFETVNLAATTRTEKMRITAGGNVGINDTAPAEKLDVDGNINVTGVYKVDDVQVVSNRVIDARCDDAINSGDATTDGVIDALRDAMIAHGLIAAA